jgi:hypothetical protein
MISSGDTLMSAKSGEAFSRLTSSIVRVASTSVHTDTCGAVYAERTMPDAVALRTPLTGIVSSRRPPAPRRGSGRHRRPGSSARARRARRGRDVAEDARLLGVAHDVVAGDLAGRPLGATSARSTPRSRASLRTGGFATTPTDAVTAAARAAGRLRREVTAPPVP